MHPSVDPFALQLAIHSEPHHPGLRLHSRNIDDQAGGHRPMKALTLLAVAALATGALLVPAEEAEAFAWCVLEVHNTGGEPCGGVVCIGYSSHRGWQSCYPPYRPPCYDHGCPPP